VHERRKASFGCAIAALVQLTACGEVGTSADASRTDCEDAQATCSADAGATQCGATAPAFADVSAFSKCSSCHAAQLTEPARHGAPASVNFDSESAALTKAKEAAALVTAGAMPPPGSGVSLSAPEKQTLLRWAECL
jgi:uncharacterized membrane protein